GDRRIEQLRLQDFLLIGIIQGITAIPGISRLGFTLGIGLIIGLMWMDALKLSFLLSLPTILFANLYELVLQTGGFSVIKLLEAINGQGQWIPPLSSSNTLIGVLTFITSFASGLFAVRILSSHLTRKLLGYFGLYCLSAGVFFILYYQLF
ncbi:MAG TPA: undecaprenyl-diphosphate phosphatase, partial [Candidatus Nanoarchaeia archaeon]|nr:undecaprenyl-diphosphate phosphatase [Candidatus Nanoarchaeia archaeon]